MSRKALWKEGKRFHGRGSMRQETGWGGESWGKREVAVVQIQLCDTGPW